MVKTKDPYGRNTSTVYRRKVLELKNSEKGRFCYRCGDEIDRTLPTSDANSTEYWTAEHDPALSEGGDLIKDLVGGSHRRCNSILGRQMQILAAAGNTIETSRAW